MVALQTTRHPNERPTHPVDPSRAPKKPRNKRIRSSSRGASFDRIDRPSKRRLGKPGKTQSSLSNASYDRIGARAADNAGTKLQTQSQTTSRAMFSYQTSSRFYVGVRLSLFS